MRVVPLVVSACALAGCDSIWDLEHLDEPTPLTCASPIGHDEDGDGIDDACDPCPFDVNNDGDADDDGIADRCDPDPAAKDVVVLFSGFDAATRAQFTITDGGFGNDAFQVMGVGTQSLIWNADPDGIWLVAGIDVEALEDQTYREIGVVFDASVTSSSSQLNGTYCVLGRYIDQDYLETFLRSRPDGDELINHSDVDLPLSPFHGIIRASYQRTATPAASCTFVTQDQEKTITGSPSMQPSVGKLGLSAGDMTAEFRFLYVVRRM